jgi:hypothetical protein
VRRLTLEDIGRLAVEAWTARQNLRDARCLYLAYGDEPCYVSGTSDRCENCQRWPALKAESRRAANTLTAAIGRHVRREAARA